MSRTRLTDLLQSHLFWAFDAARIGEGLPVFNPLFGFSKITAPQISAEIESFKDGTFLYNRNVVKGGSVGAVTFERAASMFDADFYDWIMFTLHGNKDFEEGGTLSKASSLLLGGGRSSPRRNILVVQFTSINIGNMDLSKDPSINKGAGLAGLGIAGLVTGALAGTSVGAAIAGGLVGVGPFQFATRVPGRAWLLNNCLPTRYKSGSDFDAKNAEISLQELEVLPESISEFSLGLKP